MMEAIFDGLCGDFLVLKKVNVFLGAIQKRVGLNEIIIHFFEKNFVFEETFESRDVGVSYLERLEWK